MKNLISYLLISLFLFSLAMSLPEPPQAPTMSNGQSNTSYTSAVNQSVGYSADMKDDSSSSGYFWMVGLIILLVCFGVYYRIFRTKKSLNIKQTEKKYEKK